MPAGCQLSPLPVSLGPPSVSDNQPINYTFPALGLGVSEEIVVFCPPRLSILSQPCPRWHDPKGIPILSDIISPAPSICPPQMSLHGLPHSCT